MAFTSQSDSRTNRSYSDPQNLTPPGVPPYSFFQPSVLSNYEQYNDYERPKMSAFSQLQVHNEQFDQNVVGPSLAYAPYATDFVGNGMRAS